MEDTQKKSKKNKIIAIIIVIMVILILTGILIFKISKDKKNNAKQNEDYAEAVIEEEKIQKEETEKSINIYNGDDRPIAVMIDNHKGAWPQSGLNNTYLVYEIIVEGGETRLMALFKGKDLEQIGPVRSSRHYFLDYAMENDAIYVHYGWSPQAKSDISKYSVDNINGINYSTSDFWRVSTKSSPHNVMTSTDKILDIAKKLGYRTTSNITSLLNYVPDNITLDNGTKASKVTIEHSNLQNVQYKYNDKTGKYTRYARGVLQKDYSTGEEITTKNIIIECIDNYTLQDSSNKGRQTLSNIGTFDGYYITNGNVIKITCTKSSRTSRTVYKDLDGNVIEVNDGNTWINICPTNANINFE